MRYFSEGAFLCTKPKATSESLDNGRMIIDHVKCKLCLRRDTGTILFIANYFTTKGHGVSYDAYFVVIGDWRMNDERNTNEHARPAQARMTPTIQATQTK